LDKDSFEGKEGAIQGSAVGCQCLSKDGARMLRPVRQQVALAKIASIASHDVDHCRISHDKQKQKEQQSFP
jgi:hypothetical protein